MRRKMNRCLGWKRITKRYTLSMEDKMAAGAFGRARNYGWWFIKCSNLSLQVNVLLSEKQLKEEITYLEQNRELRSRLTAARTWTEKDKSTTDERRLSTDIYFNSDRLRLVLKWCKTVCRFYNMKVKIRWIQGAKNTVSTRPRQVILSVGQVWLRV